MTGSTKLMTPSGGGVTLTPTNTATDKTLTIPADNGTLVYANSSGNVGVGTSSPSSGARLTVTGASSSIVRLFNNNQTTGSFELGQGFSTGSDNIGYVWNNSNAAMVFGTNATERMRIDSSGNVLVGTTSLPSANWSNSFQTNRGSGVWPGGFVSTDRGVVVRQIANGSGFMAYFEVNNGATTVGSISNTSTNVAYNTTSDYRLKENIQPMQNALGVVAQLNPVTYTWKADGSDGQGFIAHELQAVVPDCVTGEKDAVQVVDVLDDEGRKIGTKEEPVYQGIDTSFLVATLTKAIQELKEELDEAKARITALEAK